MARPKKNPEETALSKQENKPVKKRSSNGGMLERKPNAIEKERAQELVSYVAELSKIGRGVNKKDAADLRQRFYQYVELTLERGMKIGNMCAYTAMGITRDDAKVWRAGVKGTIEHHALMEEVDKICASFREISTANGDMNVAWGIFSAKNYDGMTDEQKVVVSPIERTTMSAAEIADKYRELPE